jgi:hypothetical protein
MPVYFLFFCLSLIFTANNVSYLSWNWPFFSEKIFFFLFGLGCYTEKVTQLKWVTSFPNKNNWCFHACTYYYSENVLICYIQEDGLVGPWKGQCANLGREVKGLLSWPVVGQRAAHSSYGYQEARSQWSHPSVRISCAGVWIKLKLWFFLNVSLGSQIFQPAALSSNW